ncbi:MAG: NfeD family protein [Acidobacteria bacterium]|nr:NfeD family protein [Acidobacteriota bacterium]
MSWWMWLAGGLVLMVAELATPSGFYLLFFGLGAFGVALLAGAGVLTATGPQLLAFTVLSLTSLVLFRGPVLRRFQQPPSPDLDPLVGSLATPAESIAPGSVGRVEVRGTAWTARNVDASHVAAGQRCVVTHVDGLLLSIRPE